MGVEEVETWVFVSTIEQIRDMVRANSDGAGELASSAEELSRQAGLLRQLTSRFHVEKSGS